MSRYELLVIIVPYMSRLQGFGRHLSFRQRLTVFATCIVAGSKQSPLFRWFVVMLADALAVVRQGEYEKAKLHLSLGSWHGPCSD